MQSSTNNDKRHKTLLFFNTLSMKMVKMELDTLLNLQKLSMIKSKLNVKAMSLSIYNIKESIKKNYFSFYYEGYFFTIVLNTV